MISCFRVNGVVWIKFCQNVRHFPAGHMWKKMMGEKVWVLKQISKKESQKNEHACSVEGVFEVSDSRQIQSSLSSNNSEIDQQKSCTLCWGSL